MFNKIKSPETLFSKDLETYLDLMLKEQRHQRADLATIKRQLHTLITDTSLQKQVDDYIEDSAQREEEKPD